MNVSTISRSNPSDLMRPHRAADLSQMAANSKVLIDPCEEKQRLRVLYSQAKEGSSRAVNEVLLSRGKADYDRIRALADEARRAANSARSALEQHKQEHGC